MSIQMVTLEELAQTEAETMRGNIAKFPLGYAFANNALSLMSTGITGYASSRRAFGAYLSQINVNLCLALMSALRQHTVQSNSSLRHVLEHVTLASYALIHIDESQYFETDANKPIDHKKLMTDTVYPWFREAYPKENEQIKDLKADINKSHGHASILHAYRNMEGFEDDALKVQVNYIDFHNALSVATDLCHIGHVGFLSLMTIGVVNERVGVIRGSYNLRSEAKLLIKLGKAALAEREIYEVSCA